MRGGRDVRASESRAVGAAFAGRAVRGRARAVAVVFLLVALGAVAGCSQKKSAHVVDGPAKGSDTGALTVAPPKVWSAADATTPLVVLYAEPGKLDPAGRSLTNPTSEGMPLVFAVRSQRKGWVQVQIPSRPNGAVAWVRAADVKVRTVAYRIVVSVSHHQLQLFEGTKVLFSAPVAVGTDQTPTPTGSFFVDAKVRLADTSGPYGTGQVSVAGFSNVLMSFGGGSGQIAIHGTNQPQLVGQNVSNGCIRVTDDVATKLLDLVPTGSPVDVIA